MMEEAINKETAVADAPVARTTEFEITNDKPTEEHTICHNKAMGEEPQPIALYSKPGPISDNQTMELYSKPTTIANNQIMEHQNIPTTAYNQTMEPQNISTTTYNQTMEPQNIHTIAYTETMEPQNIPTIAYTETMEPQNIPTTAYTETMEPQNIPTTAYSQTMEPQNIPTTAYSQTMEPQNIPTTAYSQTMEPQNIPTTAYSQTMEPQNIPTTAYSQTMESQNIPTTTYNQTMKPHKKCKADKAVPIKSKNKTKVAAVNKKKQKMMFNGQARELIMRLRTYFERECHNGGPVLPVQQVVERVSDALGVSRKTIARITTQKFGKDRMEDNNLLDWKPIKVVPKRVSEVNEIKAKIIRNDIYEYYRKMELPSLSKLVKSLGDLDVYKGGESSLRRLVRTIGFEYVPIPKRKKILMEETIQAFEKNSIPKEAIDIKHWKNVMIIEKASFGPDQSGMNRWDNMPKEKMVICHTVNTTTMPKYCLVFPANDMDTLKFRDWFLKILFPYY